MGSGFYGEKVGTIYGRICSCDYERRGSFGMERLVVKYWAEIRDERDPQYPLILCPHEHREPEAAIPCRNRLMKLAVEVAKPMPCGPSRVLIKLEPDQIRDALKILTAPKRSKASA